MPEISDTLQNNSIAIRELAKDEGYTLAEIKHKAIDWGINLAIAVAVLIVGMMIAKRVTKILKFRFKIYVRFIN